MLRKKPSPELAKTAEKDENPASPDPMPPEKNGYADLGLPEPTRYNDWDVRGRCSDF